MFFSYNGKKISYSDHGKGKVIVLLHGYLESYEIWNGFAEKLESEFRVISVDLPGCGHSDVFGETHSMEFMAGVVKNLLDHTGVDKAFMAGHSMGGYVTLAFLELYPEHLSGYCLFHSQPFADTPAAIEKRKHEIDLADKGRKDLICPDNITKMFSPGNLNVFEKAVKRSLGIAMSTDEKGIIAVLNGMMIRPLRLSLVEQGLVPFLWILGANDNYINCDYIQSQVHLPPNAKVKVLNNSGHMGFVEEEDNSVETVRKFVNGIL